CRADVPVPPSDEGRRPDPGKADRAATPVGGTADHHNGGQVRPGLVQQRRLWILGYQASNRSVGDEWMLLEVGMTVLDNVPDYRMTREGLSLETPDGKTLPLATA